MITAVITNSDLDLRRLACAVIHRAVDDARLSDTAIKDVSERHRRHLWRGTARQFLNGSDALGLWCAIAQIDVSHVHAAIRRGLLDRPGTRAHRYPPARQTNAA